MEDKDAMSRACNFCGSKGGWMLKAMQTVKNVLILIGFQWGVRNPTK